MKKFIAPAIKIVKLDTNDIIATSDLGISNQSVDYYQSRGGNDDDDWDF